eukprot:4777206-Pleurochrysis_carterae.AAC.1
MAHLGRARRRDDARSEHVERVYKDPTGASRERAAEDARWQAGRPRLVVGHDVPFREVVGKVEGVPAVEGSDSARAQPLAEALAQRTAVHLLALAGAPALAGVSCSQCVLAAAKRSRKACMHTRVQGTLREGRCTAARTRARPHARMRTDGKAGSDAQPDASSQTSLRGRARAPADIFACQGEASSQSMRVRTYLLALPPLSIPLLPPHHSSEPSTRKGASTSYPERKRLWSEERKRSRLSERERA